MSSAAIKPATPSKLGQGGLQSVPPSSQALLLEKISARVATPDSEALASSDDEVDTRTTESSQVVPPPPKPVRRASWLNDTSQPVPKARKGSFASGSMSPTASNPGTPSADTAGGPWGSQSASSAMLGRSTGSFPWGTSFWNTDRKDSRLSEVLPSPTSILPPGGTGNSMFGPESSLSQTSPAPRDQGGNNQFPFAIPLHPTPKTYRSQSYSVGQLDADIPPPSMSSATALGRARPHPAIQHRPSRPSMLSEMSSEGGLGKVKEVEDDEENADGVPDTMYSSLHQSTEAKTIELLARENAMLRQQQQQYQNRIRPRSSTSAAYGLGGGYPLRESVPEESEYAIDELDEVHDGVDLGPSRRTLNRRMSEFTPGPYRSPFALDRKAEASKKGIWHSQLGFGGLGDGSQSRRHSFADVPARQASISSLGEHGLDMSLHDLQGSQDYSGGFVDNFTMANAGGASHYSAGGGAPLSLGQGSFSNSYGSPYGLHGHFGNRAPSPHRNVYGMSQPRHNQLLHIVYFKCSRADVFYIQEGTGLTVKPGDLVIVEADRGTDIGTVVRENVDWQMAKELKDYYAEEHYKWLMMYSNNAAAAQDGTGGGLMSSTNGLQGSAVGGMGPPSHHHMQESNTGELKPKLIKRLAQSHEITALREKEGNEAKAKRMCMQKVKEHGLNMEILDAEFQMDWKKLTFYYFADSYINFNSLVTDLFKIYKTRIWMSAVNPASFANPTLGLQAPSGIGPGAVGVGRGMGPSERRSNQSLQESANASSQQASRAFPGAILPQGFLGEARPIAPGPSYSPGSFASYQQPQQQQQYGGGFGSSRSGASSMPYHPAVGQTADAYSGAFAQQSDFPGARRAPGHVPGPSHGHGLSQMGGQQDWSSAFQGLSLNSR